MKTTTIKKAWELTEKEFDKLSIPYSKKIGVYTSLNGLYVIEFKTDKPKGSAGLAHCFEFFVNGVKKIAPFPHAQKLMFELPKDYYYHIAYGLIVEYAKENGLMK